MDDPGTESDHDALIRIRTQLTVALLAIGCLCRALGSLPPAERLCSLANDALLRVRDEVTGMEARLLRRGDQTTPPSDTAGENPPAP